MVFGTYRAPGPLLMLMLLVLLTPLLVRLVSPLACIAENYALILSWKGLGSGGRFDWSFCQETHLRELVIGSFRHILYRFLPSYTLILEIVHEEAVPIRIGRFQGVYDNDKIPLFWR
jgi:hypothetical protein